VARRSRGRGAILGAITAIIVSLGVLLVLANRKRSGNLAAKVWKGITNWFAVWVPAHPAAASVIFGFVVFVLIINYFAHLLGRLTTYVFAAVLETAMWLITWYGAPFMNVPSFWHMLHSGQPTLPVGYAMTVLGIILLITGLLYWFLELREKVRKDEFKF